MISDPTISVTGRRPSSANFDDPELSVVIASECTGGMETLLSGHEGFGIVAFTVGDVRAHGWGIVRAPDVHLPGHAHVTGARKTQAQRKAIARRCTVVVEPSE
jgi:alpha-D-ribose 1-methylphosphonate 5-triphosphate synthase subunit PhnG